MSQPGAPSRIALALIWLVLGLAMTVTAVWVGWTRWPAILNGHPALLVVEIACGLVGIVAVAWSVATLAIGDRYDREGDPDHPARRTRDELLRRAKWRIVLATPALVVCLVMLILVFASRPLVAAPGTTTALRSADGVRISERLSWYELVPSKDDDSGNAIVPTTALIFVPGARVDPRAYAPLLRPLADAGYLVLVLKDPFGFAIANRNHAATVIDVHPEIKNWAIAGHSLGGVVAASYADEHPEIKGLALWASYPADTLTRTDLKVVSISASEDGLATPADIEKSKPKLPGDTQYVVLPGAVHSFFGDYGDQPGDGRPTADRVGSQAEITKATQELVASVVPPPPKKKKK